MAQKRDTLNVTMYNISKKLVTNQNDDHNIVRFRYEPAFDGYAGVTVERRCFIESANPNFWHIRMPKDIKLPMTWKTGIRRDDIETREVSPREFKDLFEKTRAPKQKNPGMSRVRETPEIDGIEAEMEAQKHVYDMDENDLPF